MVLGIRIVLVAIALLLMVEFVGRVIVADQLRDDFAENAAASDRVTLRVYDLPVMQKVLTTGRIGRIDVTFDDVRGEPVGAERIRYELYGLDVDVSEFLSGRGLNVGSVGSVRIEVLLSDEDLGGYFALPLSISHDSARVGVRGDQTTAAVRVEGPSLVFDLGIFDTVTTPIPSADWLPCRPSARVEGEFVVLSCRVEEVPPALLRAGVR